MLQKSTVAAILQNSNAELILDEISLPEQLFHGQVLVELISSGICGAQINEIDAVKGPDRFLPHLLGHEGYAKILEIGGGVSTVASGDYVVMHWRPGSGIEAKPAKYEWRGKNLNSGWVTTFNRHSVVSENRITKIEPGILQKEIIPLMGCALTTALGVLEKEAKANFRDMLLILGAGGVGLTLVKVAKFLGVSNIVIVDTDKSKIIKAKEIGATSGIVFQNKEQVLTELKQLYPNSLPSIAIDTSGQPSAIEICYEASAANARVVLVGVPKLGSNVNIYTLPLHFGKSIMGSKGGGSNPDVDIPILIDLILTKKLDFSDFPTSTYGFNDINKAIRDLRRGLVGRVIVDFDK